MSPTLKTLDGSWTQAFQDYKPHHTNRCKVLFTHEAEFNDAPECWKIDIPNQYPCVLMLTYFAPEGKAQPGWYLGEFVYLEDFTNG